MFSYFHKKLTPRCSGQIRHLFWGASEELLAFDNGNGGCTLLDTTLVSAEGQSFHRVMPEPPPEERKSVDHQTLTHPGDAPGTVRVVFWNSVEEHLCTIDEQGNFLLWKRENKVWTNEAIQFSTGKGLKDCAISPDKKKLCLLYSDGRLYLCTTQGQKLWSKELKRRMRHVLWSPSGLELLLCSEAGEIFFYDCEGFYTHSLHSRLGGKGEEATCGPLVSVADVDWHTGDRRLNSEPALAIAYDNGFVHIFKGHLENKSITLDAHLVRCTAAAWRPTGDILAILGKSHVVHPLVPTACEVNKKPQFVIRFYSATGSLLHTLLLPENREAETFCWNITGDQIVVASGSTLFFAKIRPKYDAAYIGSTLVYTSPAIEGSKQFLWFWNTDSHSKHLHLVDKVLHIRAAAEACLVVTEAHSCERSYLSNARYTLAVYNASGDIRKVFRSGSKPKHAAFTDSSIIIAGSHSLDLWVYNFLTARRTGETSKNNLESIRCSNCLIRPSSGGRPNPHVLTTGDASCGTVPKSCSFVKGAGRVSPKTLQLTEPNDANPIVAITAHAQCFMVARKCGEVTRYSLPDAELHYRFNLSSPPLTMQLNHDGSRLAVIDVLQVLRLYDVVQPKRTGTSGLECHTLDTSYQREHVDYVLWASDHPDSLAFVHKNVFYIAHGTTVEEIVKCSAWLLDYKDLRVRGAYLDKLLKLPSRPENNHVYEFCTKPLRDTRAILLNPVNLQDCLSYVDRKSHPSLWRLLATAALKQLNFTIAEEAYVKCQDYFGLLFLTYIKSLNRSQSQKEELYAYFDNTNGTERVCVSADSLELADLPQSSAPEASRLVAMRRERNCAPPARQNALMDLADFYKEKSCWFEAIEFYRRLQYTPLLAHALYVTEQYEEMYNLVERITEGDVLLAYIGRRLASVGMCDEAVTAYRKARQFTVAMEVCATFKSRETAEGLSDDTCAQRENLALTELAKRFLEQNRSDRAIEFQGNHSAIQKAVYALLKDVQVASAGDVPSEPVKAKMVYVLGGLLSARSIENVPKPSKCFSGCASESSIQFNQRGRSNTRKRLTFTARVSTQEAHSMSREIAATAQTDIPAREGAAWWRGAEAYHLFLLYHEHLARKRFTDAVCTATRLIEYSKYVKLCTAYAMLALASYYARNWWVCSASLMRLDSVQTVPMQHKAKIAKLAVDIFSRHSPVLSAPEFPAALLCPHCHARLQTWNVMCTECGASSFFCVRSGGPIFVSCLPSTRRASVDAAGRFDGADLHLPNEGSAVVTCRACKCTTLATAARNSWNCALCHTPFTAFPGSTTGYHTPAVCQTYSQSMLYSQSQKACERLT